MNRAILAIFIVITLFACRKPSNQQLTAEEGQAVFVVRLKQQAEVNKMLKLSISTKASYPCINFGIETKVSKNGNDISIELGKVIESAFCLTAIGPANAEINLGALSNGTYNLRFAANSKILSGSLIVTDEKYTLNIPRQNTLSFVNPVLNRIPDNTIWGLVEYSNNSVSVPANLFIDSLKILGAAPKKFLAGDYSEFVIDNTGKIPTPDKSVSSLTTIPYIFQYSGASEPLRLLVQRFGTKYDKLLWIRLFRSNGEYFYSWMK